MSIISPLLLAAEHHIQTHSKKLVSKMIYEDKIVWIKQRPFSKKTPWHHLQQYLAKSLRRPILSSTATLGGPESLKAEAFRLTLFASKQIAVPKVLGLSDNLIITEDVGQQLPAFFQSLNNKKEINYWLEQAIILLKQVHYAGLCHARPYLRDITIFQNKLYLIDLEEDPLTVMSLAEAQARDVWLFFNSLTRYYKEDLHSLQNLFQLYKKDALSDTLFALDKFVKLIKPIRKISEYIPKKILGKDSVNAMAANRVLEGI